MSSNRYALIPTHERALFHYFFQNQNRIRLNSSREQDELHHVEPPFSELDLRNVRLRSLKATSHVLLPESSLLPGAEQQRPQMIVGR